MTMLNIILGRMGLGEVVGRVVLARLPEDRVLQLLDPVLEPIPPHVHRLGAFLDERLVGDTLGSAVVRQKGSRWLRESHILQRVAGRHCGLSVDVASS